MAAQNASEYIAHHLTNLKVKVGEGAFWTLNMDTIVRSWGLGLVRHSFFGIGMIAGGITLGIRGGFKKKISPPPSRASS